MSDERLHQRIYDGNRAKEVLENEAFAKAFEDIESEVVEAWKKSPARDEEGREKLWQYLTLLGKVKTQLEASMRDGQLAELDLNHQRTLKERVMDGWHSLTE
ncbi:MAG: hypothetical protein KGN37_17125 [Burkholderiales bacterium]|nr:hypothetical protein [Burkholderiales bacterium]MDE2434554.1 hypothetical protein [Burkholderiales bacterium]